MAANIDVEVQLFRKYKEVGVNEFGLDGKQLMAFVHERVKEWKQAQTEREEKEKERQAQIEREEKERQAQIEREEKERQTQIELAKISEGRQTQIEQDRMRHELELARLNQELELERVRVSAREVRDDVSTESGISGRSVVDHRLVQISMPRFDDRVESIDDFLTQFEKLAQAHGIPTQHWAINVSAFLQGSARDVYHSLSSNESDEYAVLKKALLRHYRLTAENYRKMFRESTKKGSETHSQFHARVRGLFERWIKMAEVEQTYEGLREIILKEHVLNTYRKDLTIFLAEREHRTLEEIADMAERYELAHPKSGGSGLGDKPRNNEPRRMGEGGVANRNRQGEGKVGGVSSVKGSDPKPRPNSPSHREFTDRRTAPTCYNCKRPGHLARDCRSRKAVQVNAIAKKDSVSIVNSMPMNIATGTVNDNPVKILYDTGCNVAALVDQKFVRSDDYIGENVEVVYANKQREILPLAMIDLVSPYVKGRIEAACTKNGIQDVILGCRYVIPQPNPEGCLAVNVAAVETRAQRRQPKPISLGSTTMPVSNVMPEELKKLQQEDISLTTLHKHANTEATKETKNGVVNFLYKRGILYRQVRKGLEYFKQVIVPKGKREEVLRLAHEGIMGAHMGIAKTRDRVVKQFYWPGVQGDVKRFCLSCDKCQRMSPRANQRPIPLGNTPLIDEPFKRVAMDLIGPIIPASNQGNRYILTVVDYATRYPEAVALRNIDTETVAEALLGIWSRVGVPQEVLTDQGTQFTSHVMEEVNRLLSIDHLTTTPYHPQCNGLVERFNGTLKNTLKKLCEGRPRDWDRYIPATLFAYREVPQASLGFSPFELLYGRTVRGPMSVLKQLWTDEHTQEEVQTTFQYVTDLRNKLEEVCTLAQENLKGAKVKQASYYNKRTKAREYSVGDKVLLLLPQEHNKLQVSWRGPYEVTEKLSGQTYRIRLPKKEKLFHANLLKKYQEREPVNELVVATILVEDNGRDTEGADTVPSCSLLGKETYLDVGCDPDLTTAQRLEVESVLQKYPEVLTEIPGRTSMVEFGLKLLDDRPIQQKPYPLPHAKREVVKKEIEQMLVYF